MCVYVSMYRNVRVYVCACVRAWCVCMCVCVCVFVLLYDTALWQGVPRGITQWLYVPWSQRLDRDALSFTEASVEG